MSKIMDTEALCQTIITQSGSINITGVILSVPEILSVAQNIHSAAPSFLTSYIPLPPDGCETNFQHIAKEMASAASSSLSRLPSAFARLAPRYDLLEKAG